MSFEEPSRGRLAREWGVSEERAAQLLRGRATHAQPEQARLGGQLYRREDVDGLAPYAVLAAPRSIREPDGHAVLHIVTHEASAGRVAGALQAIRALPEARGEASAMPVISGRGVAELGWA